MGRTKGALSVKTKEVAKVIQLLLDECLSTVLDDLKQLEAKDRIRVILDLFPYLIAKKRSEQTITLDTLSGPQIDSLVKHLIDD
jgi:hypothetical protein